MVFKKNKKILVQNTRIDERNDLLTPIRLVKISDEKNGQKSEVALIISPKTSDEIRKEKTVILCTKKKFEEMVKKNTADKLAELQKKIEEMKRIETLTIGREMRMIELKKQLLKLKKNPLEKTAVKNIPGKQKIIGNCWDFWQCDEKTRNDCPAFKTDSGQECWLVASSYCPHAKKEFENCTQCPWFDKLNPQKK